MSGFLLLGGPILLYVHLLLLCHITSSNLYELNGVYMTLGLYFQCLLSYQPASTKLNHQKNLRQEVTVEFKGFDQPLELLNLTSKR